MTTLDHLITSNTLAKVLHFICNAYKPFGSRDVARQLRDDPGNVNKALKRLEKTGLIEKVSDETQAKYIVIESYKLECLRELTRK